MGDPGSHHNIPSRAPPQLLVREATGAIDPGDLNDDGNNANKITKDDDDDDDDDEGKSKVKPTAAPTKPPADPEPVPAPKDEQVGIVDHIIRFIRRQSTTPVSPARLGEISRLHFATFCLLFAFWWSNQIQIALFVRDVGGPRIRAILAAPVDNGFGNGDQQNRPWFAGTNGSLVFDDILLAFFFAAYCKEALRLAVGLHLIVTCGRIGGSTKWEYAFLSFSGLFLPLIGLSQQHVSAVVKSNTVSVLVSPQIVLLDLVTVDLPQGAEAVRAFYTGTVSTGVKLSSLWTTFSVASKFSRFLWRSLLAIHAYQLEERAHARRRQALREYARAIQHLVGVTGSPHAVTTVMQRMPAAVRLAVDQHTVVGRIMAEYRGTLATVAELVAIAGIQALWRELRSPWFGGGAASRHQMGSARELRAAAKRLRLARFRVPGTNTASSSAAHIGGGPIKLNPRGGGAVAGTNETLLGSLQAVGVGGGRNGARSPQQLSPGSALSLVAAAVSRSHASLGLGSDTSIANYVVVGDAHRKSATGSVTSPSLSPRGSAVATIANGDDPAALELADVILAHAQALAYLERTPTTRVLVTDDVMAAIKALWESWAMRDMVTQFLESPATWQDRIMGGWPRNLCPDPPLKDVLAMLPFRLRLISYCLDRCERTLRRVRPKVSDLNQHPHSLAELVLGDAFGCPVTRVMSRNELAFALMSLSSVPGHAQKLVLHFDIRTQPIWTTEQKRHSWN
ncbi:hypothetical protein BC828DRAFT_397676 [Blastocladiella britannica]|nr:hypothetical protein BC828DRAFT_397676 [Blastocladiella britannica]